MLWASCPWRTPRVGSDLTVARHRQRAELPIWRWRWSWAQDPKRRRSATAASFAAALELAKAGRLDLRQDAAFQPIYLRARAGEDSA